MPRYNFPAVSDGKKPSGNEWEEDLYELIEGKDWKKKREWGPRVGTVKLKQSRRGGEEVVVAAFHFDEGPVRKYTGPVPGNGSWDGESTLEFVPPGDHKGRPTIKVISTNPKRWG